MKDVRPAGASRYWRPLVVGFIPIAVGLSTLAACVFPIQAPPAPATESNPAATTATVSTTMTTTAPATTTASVTTTAPATTTKATTTTTTTPSSSITGTVLADLKQRYAVALQDAKVAEASEIYTGLTAITPDNSKLTWDKESGRVLVVTWTSYKGYDTQVSKELTVTRETWVTAVPDLQTFCRSYQATPETPLNLRLEELLGLPPNNGKTRIVALWVKPEDLFRPSPDGQVDDSVAELEIPPASRFASQQDYEFHRDWYNLQLQIDNYDDPSKGYPWTRLGYTYDWGNPQSEVGLSEFVIYANSPAKVEKVYLTNEYCTP